MYTTVKHTHTTSVTLNVDLGYIQNNIAELYLELRHENYMVGCRVWELVAQMIKVQGKKSKATEGYLYRLTYEIALSPHVDEADVYRHKNFVLIETALEGQSIYLVQKDMAILLHTTERYKHAYLKGIATKVLDPHGVRVFLLSTNSKSLAKKAVTCDEKQILRLFLATFPMLATRVGDGVRAKLQSSNEAVTSKIKTGRKVKGCASQCYLADVLRTCPKVDVSFMKTVKPSKLVFEDCDGGSETMTMLNYIRAYKQLSKVQGDVSGEWYKVETQAQFRALTLMQGYTQVFDSCQYIPVHNLSLETIKFHLNEASLSQVRMLLEGYGSEYNNNRQDEDWVSGNVVRYFCLDEDGFILRRFYAFKSQDNGHYYLNNFYNCCPAHAHIDGHPFLASDIESFKGYAYRNCVELLIDAAYIPDPAFTLLPRPDFVLTGDDKDSIW